MTDEFYKDPPVKGETRMIAILLSLVATACMSYAAFSHHWLANHNQYLEVGFGLRTNFECAPATSDCTTHSNAEVVDDFEKLEKQTHQRLASAAFVPAGWITLVAVLLSSLGLLAGAVLAWRKIAKDLPVAPTTIALLGGMVALISGCVFVATKPGQPGMVGVGISFWLFGTGVVMGLVAAQMTAKVIRPPDPEWTA